MLKETIVVAVCLVLMANARPSGRAPAAAGAEDEGAPTPYNYQYDIQDANYTISRQEEMNEQGVVKGTYTYQDRDGLTRTVRYTADDTGFHAEVDSNEPGLTSSAPAAVTYNIK